MNYKQTRRSLRGAITVAAIGLSCCVLATIAQAQTANKCTTIKDVRSHGGWTIVTQVPNFEPYWFADEKGTYQGMDYDLLVEVNKILDVPATHYTTVAWAGVLPALQAGKSDFTPEAIAATEVRKKTLDSPIRKATIRL